ncbi:MAG TPA: YqgE/AlgH family protein [Nocardioides sp.]|jgi:putative transcriptional regulator|uniref:YqgE/AlgH family protein n=1 Tax=Nocardioides sp. TaxID=35761 RepID=UPI002E32533D|nr:YqgE/AlgH family protein [Nocardioides sp.]HEX3930433.1 YqgE/AlgH family protein [Nocardioides sp.]
MAEIRAGMLLLASPELVDPNFVDAVVLLLDTDENGAMGVVINRPSPVPVVSVLADWGEIVAEPEVLFRGGPVSPEGALAVALLRDQGAVGPGLRPVTERLAIVDLEGTADDIDPAVDGVRIFAGYAGWGAGQLEGEIEGGDWYVLPSLPPDAFQADPSDLWREVMRRQPGELAWHVNRPADPELN